MRLLDGCPDIAGRGDDRLRDDAAGRAQLPDGGVDARGDRSDRIPGRCQFLRNGVRDFEHGGQDMVEGREDDGADHVDGPHHRDLQHTPRHDGRRRDWARSAD